jgi:hypothetical protein
MGYTVRDYMQELINYGGVPTSRGDVIRDLQARGLTQIQIDAYLFGADRRREIDAGVEPWKLSQQDYALSQRKNVSELAAAREAHREHVREAVEQGLPVPFEALVTYDGEPWAEKPLEGWRA